MAEESCLSWIHHAWGVVHTWQQAWRQHDSWRNTPSFPEIKTHSPCEILMTSKTFHTKSATPLTALTFDWQEGYPTLRPWSLPPLQLWRQIMSNMGEVRSRQCQPSKKTAPVHSKFLDGRDKKPQGGSHPGLIFFRERGEVIPEFERFKLWLSTKAPLHLQSDIRNKNAVYLWGTLLQVWERLYLTGNVEFEWLSAAFEALSYSLCNIK